MTERCNVVGQQLPIPISAGDWRIVPFHEFVFFQEGPGIRHWQYRDEGIPFINIRCLVDGRLDVSSMNCIDPIEVDEKYQHFLLDAGDYVVSSSGTIGRLAEVSEDDLPCMLNTSVIRMRPRDERLLHRRFLRYFLTSSLFQDQIRAVASGSVQLNYGPTHLKQIWLCVPPLPEQHVIAHVLGTLDDKIELNRRMNETLEEMARALFKSWFVDFDPVRAKIEGRWRRGQSLPGLPTDLYDLFPNRLVDSELGQVPEGWEVKPLGDCFNLTMGQSPPGRTYNDDGNGLPFFQGSTDFGFRYPDNRRFCTAPTRIAQADDTLVSVRAPVGAMNMAWEKCCIGRGVASLRHKVGSSTYTYYAIWAMQQEVEQYDHTGTVFGAITRKQFETLLITEPYPVLIDSFESLTLSLDKYIRANTAESRALALQRDALLPRLVSGESRVEDIGT